MSNMYVVDIGLEFSNYDSEEQLEEHMDCILDAMYEDERAVDPDYTATLAEGTVEYSVSVEAETQPRALDAALTILRAAVHAADCHTPSWDATFKQVHAMIRDSETDLALA